jgi:hypothetical protein
MTALIGEKLTVPTTDQKAGLGDTFSTVDGKVFMYVRANAAVIAYAAVSIDENFDATELTHTLAQTGMPIGVNGASALADNEYAYVQVEGPSRVAVVQNPAVDIALYTTATDGVLDDAVTTAQTLINGIMLTAQAGTTAASSAPCLIVRRLQAATY